MAAGLQGTAGNHDALTEIWYRGGISGIEEENGGRFGYGHNTRQQVTNWAQLRPCFGSTYCISYHVTLIFSKILPSALIFSDSILNSDNGANWPFFPFFFTSTTNYFAFYGELVQSVLTFPSILFINVTVSFSWFSLEDLLLYRRGIIEEIH